MAYETVVSPERLRYWTNRLLKAKLFAIDTETTGTDPLTVDLVGVSLALGAGDACYIPVGHTVGKQLPKLDVLRAIAPACANAAIVKVLHNATYDIIVLARNGVALANVDDTQAMSYSLTGKELHFHSMDALAKKYLDHRTIEFGEVVIPRLGMAGFQDVRLDHATEYAAEDTDITLQLFRVLQKALVRDGLWDVYTQIDRPLPPILADMKMNGIGVSRARLRRLDAEWSGMIKHYTEVAAKEAPGLDINSAQAVGKFLYEDNGFPVVITTDKGAASTDVKALELMDDRHPVIPAILGVRKYGKLVSTYTAPLQKWADPDTHRVHADLKAWWTNTARFSSAEPNLQNIPVRGGEGAALRACFVAARGRQLLSADYSQIELRVLAHASQEPTLLEAFRSKLDVHTETALKVFSVDRDDFLAMLKAGDKRASDMRRFAKTINFGLVYGMSKFGLAMQLKIDPDQAQEFIDRYFEHLPNVQEFIEDGKRTVREFGYTETLYGRRMYQPGARMKWDRGAMRHAERAGVNAIIQGTAADMMRLALDNVHFNLTEYNLPADMMLTVHDEILIEVDDEYAEDTAKVVKAAMEQAGGDWIDWTVPIVCEPKWGGDWNEAH